MSHQMQRDFYASNLPPTARFVAVTLAWHHNEQTGRCDPSLPLLAQETGLCIRAVRQALRTIEAAGHISSIPRPGGTPLYRLHPATPAADAAHPGITCPPAGNAPRHQIPPTPAPHASPPRQEMPPTPAPHAAKLERTGRGTGKELETYAPPMATPEGNDWLDDFEIPEPEPKAAPTPPPAPDPTPEPPVPKRKRTDARPANIEAVQAYAATLSPVMPALEAQRFWDYYESNGWRVGRNAMKDWQAAARNWNRNAFTANPHHNNAHSRNSPPNRNGTSQPLPQAEGLNRNRLPPGVG